MRRHSGVLGPGGEAIGEAPAVVFEFERPASQFTWEAPFNGLCSAKCQAPFAELAHERRLVFDQHNLAVIDDAELGPPSPRPPRCNGWSE